MPERRDEPNVLRGDSLAHRGVIRVRNRECPVESGALASFKRVWKGELVCFDFLMFL